MLLNTSTQIPEFSVCFIVSSDTCSDISNSELSLNFSLSESEFKCLSGKACSYQHSESISFRTPLTRPSVLQSYLIKEVGIEWVSAGFLSALDGDTQAFVLQCPILIPQKYMCILKLICREELSLYGKKLNWQFFKGGWLETQTSL